MRTIAENKIIPPIGRSLDVNYRPNRHIIMLVGLSLPIAILIMLYNGEGVLYSIKKSLIICIPIFLIWAISRELDPDNDYSAFVPIPIFILVSLYLDLNPIVIMLTLLVSLRMINRSVGLPFSETDYPLIIVFSAMISYYLENMYIMPIVGTAILIDTLIDKNFKRTLYFLLSIAVAVILAYHFDMDTSFVWIGFSSLIFVIFISFMYFPLIYISRNVRSVGDMTGVSLDPARMMACQIFFLSSIIAMTFFQGMEETYPYWSIALGISIYNICLFVRKKVQNNAIF